MYRAVYRIRMLLLFIATAVLSAFGFSSLLPVLKHQAGIPAVSDGGKVALSNQCVPDKDDSDDIYFLSCGGIY